MKRKKLLALLLGVAMILGSTACGNSASSGNTADEAKAESAAEESETAEEADGVDDAGEASSDGEKIIISFYEHSDSEKIAKAQVEAYNASQDKVEVQLSLIANDDYDDKIKVMLAGGADIDCFWVRGVDGTRQMAEGGAILPLDDLMAQNNVDFSEYGTIGEAFQINGNTYGLLTTKACWLLWYNKTLFDEAGIDYPLDLTWDEYADLSASLNTGDKRGGIVVNWNMNLGSAAAGEYLIDENLERTAEYVSFLNRIYNEDASNMSLEEMSGSFDVYSVFAEGNTYMMFNGDWTFLLMPDYNPDFEWGAAPMPHFEDVPVNSTVGGSGVFCINSKSEKAEAAFDFINFCCHSDEGAIIYAENASIPAYPSDAALEVYKQTVTVPGTEYVFDASVRPEDSFEDYYSEIKDAYKAEITEYLIGNCSQEEAIENFKARRTEIMEK